MTTLVRRSVLQIGDKLADLPRLVLGKLTVPRGLIQAGLAPKGAKLALAMRPHEARTELVLDQPGDVLLRAESLASDGPVWPRHEIPRKAGLKELERLSSERGLGKAQTPLHKGQWAGHLELHRSGDTLSLTVRLRRSVASYGKLWVVGTAEGWTWRFERKQVWFGEAKTLEGLRFPTLKDCVVAGMKGMLGAVSAACAVKDTHRRQAFDTDYAERRPAPVSKPIRQILSGFGSSSKRRRSASVKVPVGGPKGPDSSTQSAGKVKASAKVASELPRLSRDETSKAQGVLDAHAGLLAIGEATVAQMVEDYATGAMEPSDREIPLSELEERMRAAGGRSKALRQHSEAFDELVQLAIASLRDTPWCLRRLSSMLGRMEAHLAASPCDGDPRLLARKALDRAWLQYEAAVEAWVAGSKLRCDDAIRRSAREAADSAKQILKTSCPLPEQTGTKPGEVGGQMYLTRAGLKALAGKHSDPASLVGTPATLVRLPRKKSTGKARVAIAGQSLLVPWKHLSDKPPTERSQQTLRRQLSGDSGSTPKRRKTKPSQLEVRVELTLDQRNELAAMFEGDWTSSIEGGAIELSTQGALHLAGTLERTYNRHTGIEATAALRRSMLGLADKLRKAASKHTPHPLHAESWWSDAVNSRHQHSKRELAERYGVSTRAMCDALAAESGRYTPASRKQSPKESTGRFERLLAATDQASELAMAFESQRGRPPMVHEAFTEAVDELKAAGHSVDPDTVKVATRRLDEYQTLLLAVRTLHAWDAQDPHKPDGAAMAAFDRAAKALFKHTGDIDEAVKALDALQIDGAEVLLHAELPLEWSSWELRQRIPYSGPPIDAPRPEKASVSQEQADAVLVDAIQKQLNQALGLS